MKKIFFLAGLLMISGSTFAATTYVTGYVKRVMAHEDGSFTILVNTTNEPNVSNATKCNPNFPWIVFTPKENRDPRVALSIALSAQAQNKKVEIYGAGVCTSPGSSVFGGATYEVGSAIRIGDIPG